VNISEGEQIPTLPPYRSGGSRSNAEVARDEELMKKAVREILSRLDYESFHALLLDAERMQASGDVEHSGHLLTFLSQDPRSRKNLGDYI
jgi:hypothetical protein